MSHEPLPKQCKILAQEYIPQIVAHAGFIISMAFAFITVFAISPPIPIITTNIDIIHFVLKYVILASMIWL